MAKVYTDEEYKKLEFNTFGGTIEQLVTSVPANKVTMRYFSYEGEELTKDSDLREVAFKYMWVCDVDGIDERLIRRVEFPTFDYTFKPEEGKAFVKIYSDSVKTK